MHNEGPIIERTLASLMGVDYDPLQIIVADDGSTDDTLDAHLRLEEGPRPRAT